MNNLEMNLFDLASEDLVNEDLSDEEFSPWFYGYTYGEEKAWEEYKKSQDLYGDGSVKAEIDACWKEYEEYWDDRYFDLLEEEDNYWWNDEDYDDWDVWDDAEWDIDELEDYIHLCGLCGFSVSTETVQDVLAVWEEMEKFLDGTFEDDYEEELLAESEIEEKPTRTHAERRKKMFRDKARRAAILKSKGHNPEDGYCEKWFRQGKKISEIRSKKRKDSEKIFRQAKKARRNPDLSGKGNAYRKTVRGWYD